MNRNTFGFGVLIAFIIPIIGFLIWLIVNFILDASNVLDKNGEIFQFSEKTRVLTAVCCNLIPFHLSKNRRWDNMLRGVGLVTISMMFGWAFYYGVLHF